MSKQKLIFILIICAAITIFLVYISVGSYSNKTDLDSYNELENAYSNSLRNSSSVWLNYKDTCYVYLYQGGGKPNSKLAAFDFDDTLIKPVSNPKFPKNATDWEYLSNTTRSRLEQVISSDSARFVIFSNQHEVRTGVETLDEIQERIELAVEGIGIPCTAFIAIEMDEFHKPGPGMFRLFERSFKGPVAIDYDRSFYCGDAVGYPAFSDSDLRFAQNVGLPFISPEDFLLNKKPKLVENI